MLKKHPSFIYRIICSVVGLTAFSAVTAQAGPTAPICPAQQINLGEQYTFTIEAIPFTLQYMPVNNSQDYGRELDFYGPGVGRQTTAAQNYDAGVQNGTVIGPNTRFNDKSVALARATWVPRTNQSDQNWGMGDHRLIPFEAIDGGNSYFGWLDITTQAVQPPTGQAAPPFLVTVNGCSYEPTPNTPTEPAHPFP